MFPLSLNKCTKCKYFFLETSVEIKSNIKASPKDKSKYQTALHNTVLYLCCSVLSLVSKNLCSKSHLLVVNVKYFKIYNKAECQQQNV